MANRLINETSPYLLQHAHNPVDWYPWGNEAFEAAEQQDKPILLSIGYSACHWCHVMERESFEDPQVAALMNRHFINIKVDREERPDVDQIYMDAVQAMDGNGGWPLNVFLTPDKKPFYGGTYFPPRRAFNRSSWTEVLQAVAQAFQEKRSEISEQAEKLTAHLSGASRLEAGPGSDGFNKEEIHKAFEAVMKTADRQWGGFGQAPKFPQTFSLNFLLAYGHLLQDSENGTNSTEALEQVFLSLDKMCTGGIYDHVGGGFARYSTDTEWLAPHFEKMLYDNALLVHVLTDAYRITGKPLYRNAIVETLDFVERELMSEEHGFYAALDADSEGEEGKFYVWTKEEVMRVVQQRPEVFCRYFDIKPGGNWEGHSIPRALKPITQFAADEHFSEEELSEIINLGKKELFKARSQRVHPGLDDKIILSWNALMNVAFSKASLALNDDKYLHVARKNMELMLTRFGDFREGLFHTLQAGIPRHPAFLEDYAYLAWASLEYGMVKSEFKYLDTALAIAEKALEKFGDETSALLYFTAEEQHDVIIRKQELFDGATPSANAVMAHCLYRLSIIFDKPGFREKAESMVRAMSSLCVKFPSSFGHWLCLYFEMTMGTNEVAIVGSEHSKLKTELDKHYLPHSLILSSAQSLPEYPLLADKNTERKTHIFLCKDYVCRKPVSTLEEFFSLWKAE